MWQTVHDATPAFSGALPATALSPAGAPASAGAMPLAAWAGAASLVAPPPPKRVRTSCGPEFSSSTMSGSCEMGASFLPEGGKHCPAVPPAGKLFALGLPAPMSGLAALPQRPSVPQPQVAPALGAGYPWCSYPAGNGLSPFSKGLALPVHSAPSHVNMHCGSATYASSAAAAGQLLGLAHSAAAPGSKTGPVSSSPAHVGNTALPFAPHTVLPRHSSSPGIAVRAEHNPHLLNACGLSFCAGEGIGFGAGSFGLPVPPTGAASAVACPVLAPGTRVCARGHVYYCGPPPGEKADAGRESNAGVNSNANENCGQASAIDVSHAVAEKPCPYCSGELRCLARCVAETHPDVAAEWNYARNEKLCAARGLPLTPYTITAGCNRKVWWLCANGHEWEVMVNDRTRRRRSRCPFCTGRRVTTQRSLRAQCPDVAALWHPTRNDHLVNRSGEKITPDQVSPNSDRRVWWKSSDGKEWEGEIRVEVRKCLSRQRSAARKQPSDSSVEGPTQ